MSPLLSVKNLRKEFLLGGERVNALDDISFDVEAGSFVVIMGRSGSGKSTLLNIVGGLDKATAGSVVACDKQLSDMSGTELAAFRRNQVGFVFQSFNLVPSLSACENVMLPLVFSGVGKKERKQRAEELLGTFGLGNRAKHRPTELSGGEQQRVAIARALAANPPILLADEPTGNLDTRTAAAIMEIFVDANKKDARTILMVTHDLNSARALCSRTIELSDGKIVGDESA